MTTSTETAFSACALMFAQQLKQNLRHIGTGPDHIEAEFLNTLAEMVMRRMAVNYRTHAKGGGASAKSRQFAEAINAVWLQFGEHVEDLELAQVVKAREGSARINVELKEL